MTLGAIHVSQVPQSGWPRPLTPPIGCNLSTNRKRKPKWRRCVAASIAVGPSAILTGSRTRPSDWGWNGRLGPVEDRRNNRRLATVTCTLCVLQILQIWWLSPHLTLPRFGGCHLTSPPHLHLSVTFTFRAEPLLLAGYEGMKQRGKTIPPQGKIRLPEAIERLVQL